MAERAQVSAIQSIADFRAALVVYLAKARPTAEEVDTELVQLRSWLENTQRLHWQREIRRLGRELEQAASELLSAKMSKLQHASAAQEMNVQHLRRELRQAEEKLAATKRWSRELENRTQPLAKEVANLHSFLMVEMGDALRFLDQVLESLQAYADTAAPRRPPPPPPTSQPS
ncbi:MAG: hypothetical protein U1F98_02340 [Verrucomicrobiota bacterium]